MIQLSLIDWQESKARKSDPATSRLAASSVSRKAETLRGLFVAGVKRMGGTATAKEASRAMSENQVVSESIRKRAKECVKMKQVAVVGIRECSVSGHKCQVYRVVEKQTPRSGVTYRIAKQDSPTRTVEIFYAEDGALMALDVSRAPHEFGYLTLVADLWAYEFVEVTK
jgi:delta-aminolevulinic acid dehydratase/porphobilinogen synthase